MTRVQRAAQLLGWIFVIIGVVGFYYARTMEMGLLLGIFPVNLLHNVVHVLFGVWGIVASKSFSGAKNFGIVGGILYLVLALVGYIAPAGGGLVPLGGNDIWLHVVLGIILLGLGLTAKSEVAAVA